MKEKVFKKNTYSIVGTVFLFLVFCWVTLFFYSIHRMLPFNPIKLPLAEQIQTEKWLPQSWEFYSRSPRSDKILVYGEDGNQVTSWPNNLVENFFGIYRYGRSQGTEIGLLQQGIPESDFMECESGYENCREGLTSQNVKNPLEKPTICGQIDIVLEEPVPWAWSKNYIDMPSKIVRLDVSCLKS